MDDQFALELYRLFQGGSSTATLSKQFQIPVDRIEQRLKAAANYITAKSRLSVDQDCTKAKVSMLEK